MLDQGQKEGGTRQRRKWVSRNMLGKNNGTTRGVWGGSRCIYQKYIVQIREKKNKKKSMWM